MRVELAQDWPATAGERQHLERILLRAAEAHLLVVTDADALEAWDHLGHLSSHQRELLRMAAEAAAFCPPATTGPHQATCRPGGADPLAG